jgi:DNA invertase Pin-like site-specific DNA recombinase
MLIGYARVSKSDESQVLDLQIDALLDAGVKKEHIYIDRASGVKEDREGLAHCLKALREEDILVVWKLDRLGRSLKHLLSTVESLSQNNIGFKVLSGQGVNIDTSTPSGKMVFSIFGALAEFERELIRERTIAGLKSARARGRKGGRKFQLTKAQVRLAQASMKNRDTTVSELCKELKITKPTLYRYVSPQGELREFGERVLGKKIY